MKNESSTLNSEPQGRALLWALPLWVSCVALLAGCGASTDDRLGGEGERCYDDLDCRVEFVCALSQCLNPDDVAAQNNGSTGGGANNATTGGGGGSGGSTGSNATSSTTNTSNTTTDGYYYVLVEDLSTQMGGESPGADLDSVSIIDNRAGVELFAEAVEDFALGGGSNLDPAQALGPPDSRCTAMNFVSLGGQGGWMIFGFGQAFGSGDAVVVYELGPTTCPNQPQWIDEDYRVSVSVSNTLSSFTEIGQGGAGINTLIVP